jgi:hypothetical protein
VQTDTNAAPTPPESPAAISTDPSTEPTVILRGDDPVAYLLVLTWACVHERLGALPHDQVALACARASVMEQWASEHGQDVGRAFTAWTEFLNEAHAVFASLVPPGGARH